MEKLPGNPFSNVVEYDATAAQKIKIGKLSRLLGIKDYIEEAQMTKGEAGRLVRQLYSQLRAKNRMRKR